MIKAGLSKGIKEEMDWYEGLIKTCLVTHRENATSPVQLVSKVIKNSNAKSKIPRYKSICLGWYYVRTFGLISLHLLWSPRHIRSAFRRSLLRSAAPVDSCGSVSGLYQAYHTPRNVWNQSSKFPALSPRFHRPTKSTRIKTNKSMLQ